ncbi:hypothetical protein P368_13095 [Comamonas thiooxydans]|nr:hypothetical protein P365_08455 [Comamonas thiooxydans]KGH11699.1 hypothetical protein P368_13095 [Comamonas thiooxydans]
MFGQILGMVNCMTQTEPALQDSFTYKKAAAGHGFSRGFTV